MADKKEQGSYSNPAILLHDILSSLIRASNLNKHNQRDVLCEVLRVRANDPALLYSRLAELYRLPMHVRRALVRAGADRIFLEWADPVEKAIFLLNGSPNTNLAGFAKDELPEAVVKLYMCRTMIDAQDSLEMQQLSDIQAAIDSAMSKVAAAEDIDPDLSDWLECILNDAAARLRMQRPLAYTPAETSYAQRLGGRDLPLFRPPLLMRRRRLSPRAWTPSTSW